MGASSCVSDTAANCCCVAWPCAGRAGGDALPLRPAAAAAQGAVLIRTLPRFLSPAECTGNGPVVNCAGAQENCITCTASTLPDPLLPPASQTRTVTISVTDCKQGASLSWACCRSTGCTLVPGSCVGTPPDKYELTKQKCNDMTSLQFTIPAGTDTIQIQSHDGRQIQGDVACNPSNCCAGNAGAGCDGSLAVCNRYVTVTLAACGVEQDTDSVGDPTPTCTKDCANHAPDTCQKYQCAFNAAAPGGMECQPVPDTAPLADRFRPNTYVCRDAVGECDVAET